MTDARPLTEVAVGLVFDPSGRVLLGQRPAGKPYAGWWEFPGGKVEPGETVGEALARELREELGIDVARSRPWVVREHSYPHARVRLHFRRVHDWCGEPVALEQQDFAWVDPHAIDREPLLPAALPILAMLRLPRWAIAVPLDRVPRESARRSASPRALVVLTGGTEHDRSAFASAIDRTRRLSGALVCLDGEAFDDLAVDARLLRPPSPDAAKHSSFARRPGTGALVGLRLHRLESLACVAGTDVDFAVVTEDVSTRLSVLERALLDASVPVYARVDAHAAPRARLAGLQGRVIGDW